MTLDPVNIKHAQAVLAHAEAVEYGKSADDGHGPYDAAERAHRDAERAMVELSMEVSQSLWRHRREAIRFERLHAAEGLTPVA